jgi:hypothetical protein
MQISDTHTRGRGRGERKEKTYKGTRIKGGIAHCSSLKVSMNH